MLWALNDEVLNYRDQIPSQGLLIFPKPVTALEHTLCQIQVPIKGACIEDLLKFLKPYNLEEKNHSLS